MNGELAMQGIVKQFGQEIIIDGISFQVREGEFLVLLGPSGGGKSTILRLISGLEQPDKGRIVLGQQDITQLTPQQRNIGMVFQDFNHYPHMSVYGNIAYSLEVQGYNRVEIKKRIRETCEMLGISLLMKRKITDLSGGEQQRVAFAKALVRDADIYLYDEPFSNLDAKLRAQLRRNILEFHRLRQRPSIYVTHDQIEALTMADRIAVIANKHVQQLGTPEELLRTPTNMFVARFVGSHPMNLLQTTVKHEDGQYTVSCDGFSLQLPRYWTHVLKHTYLDSIVLGLRPRAVVPQWLFNQMSNAPLLTIQARISEIQALYNEVIMTLQIGNTRLTSVYQDSDTALPRRGDNITIGIFDENLCLFDPVSEQAIRVWLDH